MTVDAAVSAAERVLNDETESGFWTPVGQFRADFVFDLGGVEAFFAESMPTGTSPLDPLLR